MWIKHLLFCLGFPEQSQPLLPCSHFHVQCRNNFFQWNPVHQINDSLSPLYIPPCRMANQTKEQRWEFWPANKSYLTVVTTKAGSKNMKGKAEIKNNFHHLFFIGVLWQSRKSWTMDEELFCKVVFMYGNTSSADTTYRKKTVFASCTEIVWNAKMIVIIMDIFKCSI